MRRILDGLPGFGKGFVWVNGFLLGRYWEIGPQVTLYLPAPVMWPGRSALASQRRMAVWSSPAMSV